MFNNILHTFLYSLSNVFLSFLASGVSPLGLTLKMLKVDFLLSAIDCGLFNVLSVASN